VKGGGKEGQGPKQKTKPPEYAATAKPDEDFGSWTAIVDDLDDELESGEGADFSNLFEDDFDWLFSGSEGNDSPALQTCSDPSDEASEDSDSLNGSKTLSSESDLSDSEDETLMTTFSYATLANEEESGVTDSSP
jgi:hypothetical protein